MEYLGFILALIFFVAGMAGTILPILPGAPLIWFGMLIYGFFTGFSNLSFSFFLWQGMAVAMVFLIDYVANIWGVRKYGGSRHAVWGSLAGIFFGVIFMGPPGIIFGPFVGAIAGELLVRKPLNEAVRSGIGSLVGIIGSMAFKILVQGVMIIWFFISI